MVKHELGRYLESGGGSPRPGPSCVGREYRSLICGHDLLQAGTRQQGSKGGLDQTGIEEKHGGISVETTVHLTDPA